MEVYEFDKCLLDRVDESMNVLSWKEEAIPASEVRNEWSYYIELQIEPAGWQALWKIPRVICEELGIRFPTVVFGNIEEVLFRELKAVFVVIAVQDDSVHLPERHEVSLEDLWPTVIQENAELNVEKTADCIDCLRFFYTQVWMPWDNDSDDDLNWVEKHLESRIRFYYDLRKGSIKRAVAAHIRILLTEARYIQQRREFLELGLGDDDDDEKIEEISRLEKSNATDLMRLHLRLAIIRREIEMLENPAMRQIYQQIKFDDEKSLKNSANNAKSAKRVSYVVTLPTGLEDQLQLLNLAKQYIAKDDLVQLNPSLQDVLNNCQASDNIYLSTGRHTIKFLEYLNDNGSIVGLSMKKKFTTETVKQRSPQDVVIASPDDESILLVFDGNFTLENITLDCRNVRTGILIKNGNVCLRNCQLIGDGESSTQQAIVCSANVQLTLENCNIKNFATGLLIKKATAATIRNVTIRSCLIGLELSANAKKVDFQSVRVIDSLKCGIYVDAMPLQHTNMKCLSIRGFDDLKKYTNNSAPWQGDCSFEKCSANIYILNKLSALMTDQTLQTLVDDDSDASSCIIDHVSK